MTKTPEPAVGTAVAVRVAGLVAGAEVLGVEVLGAEVLVTELLGAGALEPAPVLDADGRADGPADGPDAPS